MNDDSDTQPRIWVYTDEDGKQTLVTHYPKVNLTTIAHRDRSWHTWSPPRTMDDMTPSKAATGSQMLVIGLDNE